MNRVSKFIGIAAFSLMVLSLPAIASAQWRDRDDDYNRNGGYGNQGGYGNNGYNQNLQNAIRDLKQRTRNFERQTDDNDIYDNTGGGWGNRRNNGNNSSIEDLADDLKKAADRLENKFGRGRNLNNSRDEAQRVVQLGSQIARSMGRSQNGNYNGNDWYAIDNNIRVIANAYGLNYNPRNNNRNNRGNGRGNTRNGGNLPSWWPF